jgi:GT2 family glycosyltransferase
MTSPVGIIIPVYRDLITVQRCLTSVLGTLTELDAELFLVNDASPEPDLTNYCRGLREEHGLQLIEHSENRGFVASVNEGITALNGRDVIILNSDTEVPPGWIERLIAAAEACPDAASVTPFSNNATICSYPNFCADNHIPADLDRKAIDQLFAKANSGVTIEIPTGVGFCMFMRRSTIDEIGVFDEQAFGRGYGEENDWCLRASSKGWKHILCADLFVYHAGGVSFGKEATSLQANALAVMSERYPDYQRQIAAFVEVDPIEPARHAVDTSRRDAAEVIREYRQREQAIKASRYELDRQRHAQVTALDDLLKETREAAESERQRYDALLTSERHQVATREGQYHAQLEEMAEGYRLLEAELGEVNRFWPVRARRWLQQKLGSTMSASTAVFTSVAANYLPKARVLARSCKRVAPEVRFVLMLVDDAPQDFCLEAEPFDAVMTLNDLGLENQTEWAFTHTVVELVYRRKGQGCETVVSAPEVDRVFYFDPDMAVFGRFAELEQALSQTSILLTPHQSEPETTHEAIMDNEMASLKHGVFNMGFVGIADTAGGSAVCRVVGRPSHPFLSR